MFYSSSVCIEFLTDGGTHYSFNELTGEVESRVYNSEGTLVRYNGKHLADNNSQYQTIVSLPLSSILAI
jgi:hypothetical protein